MREPVTGDIVLAAHRGPFKKAFFQFTRFRAGEGYPGIIVARKEPIFTTDLQTDPRYLRTQVKDLGFRSYLCVPIEFGNDLAGSLNFASREYRRDYPQYKSLLSWAATSIAMAARLRLYEAEKLLESSFSRVTGESGKNLDSVMRDLLANVATLTDASMLAANLYDIKSGKLVSLTVRGGKEKKACIPELASGCPALSKSEVVSNKPGKGAETVPYRDVPYGQAFRVCVPLVYNRQALGVIQLSYKKVPQPPTRDVALVASLASQAASLLIVKWHYMKDKDNVPGTVQRQQSCGLAEADIESKTTDAAHDKPVSETRAELTDSVKQKPGHVLALRCLGAFQVFRGGELIPVNRFTRTKSVTLLKILAIKRGLPLSADAIAEYLWPEESPELTAHRLEVVASDLRHVIDCRSNRRGWQFIHNDKGSYRLALSSACLLDIDEYHRLLSLTRQLKATGKDEEAIALYQEMDGLYGGDLLEDEPYAEWCWMERETLRETHLDILRQLAAALAQKGELEPAIRYYRKALRMDPLREEIHRQLIHTLLKAGRRDEAYRQYFYCCDVLKRELGISPSDETELLHKALLSQGAS